MKSKIIPFLKKNWSNVLFVIALALLLFPGTGIPIKVFLNRMMAGGPTVIAVSERSKVTNESWVLTNADGIAVPFEQSLGKVVLVNFWATWCPPCLAELPSLQNLYDQLGDQVDFYFVTNEPLDHVHSFLNKKGYSIPIYQSLSNIPKELSSQSLPTTYLISKEGSIVVKEIGAAQWDREKIRVLIDSLVQ